MALYNTGLLINRYFSLNNLFLLFNFNKFLNNDVECQRFGVKVFFFFLLTLMRAYICPVELELIDKWYKCSGIDKNAFLH